MRGLLASLVLLFVSVITLSADAQMWLEDRDGREGPGFKVSDSLVLHLGLGVEGGYDTNSYYKSNDVKAAGRLRIAPYMDLATRSAKRKVQDDGAVSTAAPKVEFRLGLASDYDHHFGVGDEDMSDLNGASGIGVNTHANLVLFPQGNFSLLVDAAYHRTLDPYETNEDAHSRQGVRPGIGVRFRPGGGNLSFELGYRLDFMYFEDDTLANNNNKHSHDVRFVTSWKVFPKTAVVAKINFAPVVYYGSTTVNESSMPVRSLFGIQGLITDRFGLRLLAGYGASFYAGGPDFDSVLAEAELMFFITPFSSVRLGGQRDFVDSFYANYFVKNGGYLSFEQMIGGAFLITLKGDIYYRDYALNRGPWQNANIVSVSTDERNDIWVSSGLLLEYRFTDWLSAHVTGQYTADITKFSYTFQVVDPNTGNISNQVAPADFHKFEVFGGIRVHY